VALDTAHCSQPQTYLVQWCGMLQDARDAVIELAAHLRGPEGVLLDVALARSSTLALSGPWRCRATLGVDPTRTAVRQPHGEI